MKTILDVLNLTDLKDDPSVLSDLIDDEATKCKNAGDLLGTGEWLTSKLLYSDQDQVEEVLSKVIALWASPVELKMFPSSIEDLNLRLNEFVPEELALALVAVKSRSIHSLHTLPQGINDLAFRLSEQLSALFELEARRPATILNIAVAKFEALSAELLSAVDSFINTNCLTAKIASIEVVKKSHQLKKAVLAGERPILSEVDILLGPSFRKFCENCERQDTKGIVNRVPYLKEHSIRISSSPGKRTNSVLWNLVTARIARHVLKLLDEATSRSEAATTPSLKLVSTIIKLDLSRINREMTFSSRLVNRGEGRALKNHNGNPALRASNRNMDSRAKRII